MESTDFKSNKEKWEELGNAHVGEFVKFFVRALSRVENLPWETVQALRSVVSHHLSLMITAYEEPDTGFVNFYENGILDYLKENSVEIDFVELERLWNQIYEDYSNLNGLQRSAWEEAVRKDAEKEREIRNVNLEDNDAENKAFRKEKKVLLEMDEAKSNRESDEEETRRYLSEVSGVTELSTVSIPSLPRADGKGREINHHALFDMMYKKRYPQGCDRHVIIDCRFPAEWESGHILDSLNLWKYKEALTFFKPSEINDYSTTVFVFHCEFSSSRGPGLAQCWRDLAQKLTATMFGETDMQKENRMMYENPDGNQSLSLEDRRDYFRNVYILKGGYKEFYKHHPNLCTPRFYLPETSESISNQDKYCQIVQKRAGKRQGQKGNFVSTFMTDEEYEHWSQCWLQDRAATNTWTAQEREVIYLENNDAQGEEKEEKKQGERTPPQAEATEEEEKGKEEKKERSQMPGLLSMADSSSSSSSGEEETAGAVRKSTGNPRPQKRERTRTPDASKSSKSSKRGRKK